MTKRLSEYRAKDIFTKYAITDCGKVYSHSHIDSAGRLRKGKWLKPRKVGKGYLSVVLTIQGKQCNFLVHRLVAQNFLPNAAALPEVNHIDEDKTNNDMTNLEWCSTQYNTEYSKAISGKVVSPDGELHTFFNLRKFCREQDLDPSSLGCVLRGVFGQHKGWTLQKEC